MSNTLPIAPPPPPPNVLRCANNRSPTTPPCHKKPPPLLEECLWSLGQPELQKACFLARICTEKKPKSCMFNNITSILQVGPTCGLTALSMLLGPPANQLLHEAQQRHFTYNGEMFSAVNLYQLICDYLPIINNNNDDDGDLQCKRNANGSTHHKAIECQMHEGRLNCAKVRDGLLQGACIFVPYDPDFNHSPCLKSGHKAHWALVIGHLITDNEEFFVIARHGKAKNLAVWSLQSLSDSNSNLIEFAQPKGYPDSDFLLPPGGISGELGLRERAIIVKGLPLETTTIC